MPTNINLRFALRFVDEQTLGENRDCVINVIAKTVCENLKQRKKFLFLMLLMTSIRPCWADGYLSDRSWKIARHEKRTTSITFEDSASSPGAHWGLLFFTDAASETTPEGDEIIRYASLPHCKKPVVRLEEVFQTSPGSDALDVLYYSPSDTEQQNQKSHYPGFTVPYNPLLTRSSKTNRTDFWQLFARFAQIPCLPTRFHFTYIGSKRYISYRSGSAAWQ